MGAHGIDHTPHDNDDVMRRQSLASLVMVVSQLAGVDIDFDGFCLLLGITRGLETITITSVINDTEVQN